MSFYGNINDNLWIHIHSLHMCFIFVTSLAISALFFLIAGNMELLYITISYIFQYISLHNNDVFVNYKASY